MPRTQEHLTIGELARAAAVNVETIRFYQRRGLMSVPHTPARGVRRYGTSDLDRLSFVRSAQRLGFSLREIAELLQLEDGTRCGQARELAERKLGEVRSKRTQLEHMDRALSALVRACRSRGGNLSCPLVRSLHRPRNTVHLSDSSTRPPRRSSRSTRGEGRRSAAPRLRSTPQ